MRCSSESIRAAIYARVSSDQQAEANTIASQVEALRGAARPGWPDAGARSSASSTRAAAAARWSARPWSACATRRPPARSTGSTSTRPTAWPAATPTRSSWSRSCAAAASSWSSSTAPLGPLARGRPAAPGPGDDRRVRAGQDPGAEPPRQAARGPAAARSAPSAAAPYGYRYVSKLEGGGRPGTTSSSSRRAVVRQVFEWVGRERCSIGEVCRRLTSQGIPSPGGKAFWDRNDGLGDAQEPGLPGDGGDSARPGPAPTAEAAAAAGQARAPPAARRSTRSDEPGRPHRRAGVGQRGPVRRRRRAIGGEPAAQPADPPRGPLPAPGAPGLQAVRLCLLRQADQPGPVPGQAAVRLLPLHRHRRLSLRGPDGSARTSRSAPSCWTRPCGRTSAPC